MSIKNLKIIKNNIKLYTIEKNIVNIIYTNVYKMYKYKCLYKGIYIN